MTGVPRRQGRLGGRRCCLPLGSKESGVVVPRQHHPQQRYGKGQHLPALGGPPWRLALRSKKLGPPPAARVAAARSDQQPALPAASRSQVSAVPAHWPGSWTSGQNESRRCCRARPDGRRGGTRSARSWRSRTTTRRAGRAGLHRLRPATAAPRPAQGRSVPLRYRSWAGRSRYSARPGGTSCSVRARRRSAFSWAAAVCNIVSSITASPPSRPGPKCARPWSTRNCR